MFRIAVFMSSVVAMLGLIPGQRTAPELRAPVGHGATFLRSDGASVELDTRTGTLTTPHSRGAGLQDCSNRFQVCLTDHNGFAFAYFRKCDDSQVGAYKRLTFPPKIVSAIDNTDVWMVFDAAPRYLFHYAYSKGIVGIYVGPNASSDFRSMLHDRNFQLTVLEKMEYRIVGSQEVAACSA